MASAVLVAINVWVVWRLFFVEYLNQLPSVEGEFIAMARYIQQHPAGYHWQSLWYGGYPVTRFYQPLIHYTVAVFSTLTGLSPAHAFHIAGAIAYALGGVAFYWLAKSLSGNRAPAFCGALLFSLFSFSCVLLPSVRHDAGGIWNARRLQALVVYGELPNQTGLMLGMLALAFLHQAAARQRLWAVPFTALFAAAVVTTNWPATIALLIAILAYCAAMSREQIREGWLSLAVIGLMTTALSLPFALPSTIVSTFRNASVMGGAPTHGPRRWASEALLGCALLLVRYLTLRRRVEFPVRFVSLWGLTLLWIVYSVAFTNISILPQALRFHIAMEIPLSILAAFLGAYVCRRWPKVRWPLATAFALFCCLQMTHYRRHSHLMIRRLDITHTLEYSEARWFDMNMRGERVLAPGTVQLWINVFAGTPQMIGCCDQSVVNRANAIAKYITQTGFENAAESGDYSLLWMKIFAVHAVAIGGPRSREAYRDFAFPDRFAGRLPLLWSSGDDFIYGVPERVAGLARVVRLKDVVRDPPANGIDVAEIRPFVAALDDSTLPAASWRWNDTDSASAYAVTTPDEVFAISLNYDPGWKATAAGKPVTVRPDGLGFIVVEPHCAGPCTVELHWSPGMEPWVVAFASALALIAGTIGILRMRSSRKYD